MSRTSVPRRMLGCITCFTCIGSCFGLFRQRENNETMDKSMHGGKEKTTEVVEKQIITWKDCEPWSPPIKEGVVIKVYDGDTITIASKLPYDESPMYRWSVRLLGIDTPEIKSHDPRLKLLATKARDVLSAKILNKTIQLEEVSTEKFGRILARVIYKGQDMNNYMLENNLAYQYEGAKKLTELEQVKLLDMI